MKPFNNTNFSNLTEDSGGALNCAAQDKCKNKISITK
jgi:hypothetical protein